MKEEQAEMFEKTGKARGRNGGRKKAWQEETKVTRLPISIIEKLNELKKKNIDIKDVLNALEKVKKPRWSNKLLKTAQKLLKEGKNNSEIWEGLKNENFEDLPSKAHMSRWVKTNL